MAVVPVCPQPHVEYPVVALVPTVVNSSTQSVICLQLHLGHPGVRFWVEHVDQPVTVELVRTLLGPDWQHGSKIFIGTSSAPLRPEESSQVPHGSLVRIFPPRRGFVSAHSLLDRIQCPEEFCSLLEEDGPPISEVPALTYGLLQPLVADKVVQYTPSPEPSRLYEVLASHADPTWGPVRICRPRCPVQAFEVRGRLVESVIGAFPGCVETRVPVFVDGRAIDQPLRLVASMQGYMPLGVFLDTTGTLATDRPDLVVHGSATFDTSSRHILIRPNDLVVITFQAHCNVGPAVDPVPPAVFPPDADASGSGLGPPAASKDLQAPSGTYRAGPYSVCEARSSRDQPSRPGDSLGGPSLPLSACQSALTASDPPFLSLHSLHWPHSVQQELRYRLALSEQSQPCVVFEAADAAPAAYAVAADFDGDLPDMHNPPLPEAEDSEGSVAAMNCILAHIFCFQGPARSVSLWYHLGETIQELLVRADILHNPDPQFMKLLPVSPQPEMSFLALLFVPQWWEDAQILSALFVSGLDGSRPFLHTAFPFETVEDVLPPAMVQRAAAVSLYAPSDLVGHAGPLRPDMQMQQMMTSGALVVVQDVHDAPPACVDIHQHLHSLPHDVGHVTDATGSHDPLPTTAVLLGVGHEQFLIEVRDGPISRQIEDALEYSPGQLIVHEQRPCFDKLVVTGLPVARCFAFRDSVIFGRQPGRGLFIDSRAVGRPVCFRNFQQRRLSVDAVFRAANAQVLEGYVAYCAGMFPDPADNAYFLLEHGDTAIIWLNFDSPRSLPCDMDGSSHSRSLGSGSTPPSPALPDGAGPPGGTTDTSPASATGPDATHDRSRSPRRGAASRVLSDELPLLPLLSLPDPPSLQISALDCLEDVSLMQSSDLLVCPAMWKLGSDQHACVPRPLTDTSGVHAFLLPSPRTVLQSSPVQARVSWLDQVWAFFSAQAAALGGGTLTEGEDFNSAEQTRECATTISLELMLPNLQSLTLPLDQPTSPVPLNEQGTCQVNWSQAKYSDLLSFAPWSRLRSIPDGLDRPDRFGEWVRSQQLGVRPGPHEELCVHSDGSFDPATMQGGWGIVFVKRDKTCDPCSDVFLGCAWGSYDVLRPFLAPMQHMLDAHLMEALGLFWAAVAVLQLRFFGQVCFESDCQSALFSAQGVYKTRQHPICRATVAVHLCVRISMPAPASYVHVPGHEGTARNELADALARHAKCGGGSGPFQLTSALWFDGDSDGFAWAPFAFMCRESPDCFPGFSHGLIHWHASLPAFQSDPVESLQPFIPPRVCNEPLQPSRLADLQLRFASFNALSLAEAGEGCRKMPRQGLYAVTGRTALLAQCLLDRHVLLAGIQEARTPAGATVSNGFLRLCSGPDRTGNLGVEVWVNLQTSLGPGRASHLRFQRSDAVVLHAEPSCLIARIKAHSLDLLIASMHAPHRAHSLQHRLDWWRRVTRLCLSLDRNDLWVLALDGNFRIGSHTSSSVGDWHADPQDEAAEVAHELLRRLRLFLPATFRDNMWGQGAPFAKNATTDWTARILWPCRLTGVALFQSRGSTLRSTSAILAWTILPSLLKCASDAPLLARRNIDRLPLMLRPSVTLPTVTPFCRSLMLLLAVTGVSMFTNMQLAL